MGRPLGVGWMLDAPRDLQEHPSLFMMRAGVTPVWQLRHAPHPAQIGRDPAGDYMLLYELDAPENLFDPSLGRERVPLAAGQASAGRHFARLIAKAEPRRQMP